MMWWLAWTNPDTLRRREMTDDVKQMELVANLVAKIKAQARSKEEALELVRLWRIAVDMHYAGASEAEIKDRIMREQGA